jgi:hypothetical protein
MARKNENVLKIVNEQGRGGDEKEGLGFLVAAPAAVGLLFSVEAAVWPGGVSARTARFAFPLLLVGEEGEGEILVLISRLFVVLIFFAFHVGILEENILKHKSVAKKKGTRRESLQSGKDRFIRR